MSKPARFNLFFSSGKSLSFWLFKYYFSLQNVVSSTSLLLQPHPNPQDHNPYFMDCYDQEDLR